MRNEFGPGSFGTTIHSSGGSRVHSGDSRGVWIREVSEGEEARGVVLGELWRSAEMTGDLPQTCDFYTKIN